MESGIDCQRAPLFACTSPILPQMETSPPRAELGRVLPNAIQINYTYYYAIVLCTHSGYVTTRPDDVQPRYYMSSMGCSVVVGIEAASSEQ